MTETELQHRLRTSVDDIEASPDLLARVRTGGTRRLRHRRRATIVAATLSVILVGGLAGAVPRVLAGDDAPVATVESNPVDPYSFLMTAKTQGDLARDKDYLGTAVDTWNKSHPTSDFNSRGIFDELRGDPKVAWAGRTSAGPAAIVVQQAYLRKSSKVRIPRDGVYTLIGFVDTGSDGKSRLASESYPDLLSGITAGFLTGTAPEKTLVVVDVGKPVGYSTERSYEADGSSHRTFSTLKFTHGFSVVKVPAELTAAVVQLAPLPLNGKSSLWVAEARKPVKSPLSHRRLWEDVFPPSNLWPMTDDADSYRRGATDTFTAVVVAKSDPSYPTIFAGTNWAGYGRTADGSRVLLGELLLEPDPSRIYAVLTSKSGRTRIVPGGIPSKDSALPVAIKLPDGQGWTVAQKGAQLSYRSANGSWSKPRANALLVPASADAEVRVTLNGRTSSVPLR